MTIKTERLYKAVIEQLYIDAKTAKYRQEALDLLEEKTFLEELALLADEPFDRVVNTLETILAKK